MRSWRTWTVILIVAFITLNIIYWKAYQCSDPRFCNVVSNHNINKQRHKEKES